MDTQWISAFFHHGTYFYYHVSRAELQYFLASKNPEFLRKKRQQSNIKQILYQKKRNCIAWNWGKTRPLPWKFWASSCSREPCDHRSVVFFPNNRILNRKNVEKVELDFLSFCAVLSPEASSIHQLYSIRCTEAVSVVRFPLFFSRFLKIAGRKTQLLSTGTSCDLHTSMSVSIVFFCIFVF